MHQVNRLESLSPNFLRLGAQEQLEIIRRMQHNRSYVRPSTVKKQRRKKAVAKDKNMTAARKLLLLLSLDELDNLLMGEENGSS